MSHFIRQQKSVAAVFGRNVVDGFTEVACKGDIHEGFALLAHPSSFVTPLVRLTAT